MRAKVKATIGPVATLLSLVGLLVCPACAPEPAPPAAEPSVTITSPAQGDTVEPGDITISINARDFNIVNKLGEEPLPGEGHVHYYKDVEPPTTAGQPAVTEEGTYAVTTGESHTWEDVEPGEHTFAVQLVNNDHTPLSPPVIDEVTVTVEAPYTEAESRQMAEDFVRNSATFQFDGIEDSLELVETLYPDMEYAWQFVFQFDSRHAGYGDREGQMLAQVITPHEAVVTVERGEVINGVMDEKWDMLEQQMLEPGPSVEIASPRPGASLEANQVTVEIEVSNFSLVDKLGEEPVPGEGHVHFYMDVEVPTSPGEPAVTGEGTYAVSTENSHTWTDVSAGQHTFSVQLVNNNHTPLDPPVVDSVQVTVEEPPVSPAPAEMLVTIRDFSYQPAEVTIEPGETVTWVNEDATTHTVTGGVLDSGDIGPGESYSYTFQEPGTYDYTCEYHPSMQGTVEVEEEDTY